MSKILAALIAAAFSFGVAAQAPAKKDEPKKEEKKAEAKKEEKKAEAKKEEKKDEKKK